MTNAQIIELAKVQLVKDGLLKYTGRVLKGTTPAGEEVEIPEIQPIHTYARWQQLGYQVKKGEKSFIKFSIWKYAAGKGKKTDAELEENAESVSVGGHCFMKLSAFFTDDQVEKIEVEQA